MRAFHASGSSPGRQLAGDHRPLELEAQDDVQAVRRLVGLDADQGRLHLVDGAVEVLG